MRSTGKRPSRHAWLLSLSSENATGTPHKRFSKIISLNAKNLESVPDVAVMFSCQTLTHSAKVFCRALQIAKPKALNSEKDYPAEAWNARSFRKCPSALAIPSCNWGPLGQCEDVTVELWHKSGKLSRTLSMKVQLEISFRSRLDSRRIPNRRAFYSRTQSHPLDASIANLIHEV